jgi:hypothetical protein
MATLGYGAVSKTRNLLLNNFLRPERRYLPFCTAKSDLVVSQFYIL